MYQIQYSSVFKKQLKLMAKQGKDIQKLKDVIQRLANLEELEPKYQNHALQNDKRYKNCNECHIEPDWISVYQYINDNTLILLLAGSHSELF